MYEHIAEYRRGLMSLSDADRMVALYEDVWVPYEKWNSIRNAVETILKMPPKSQALCLLVTGESGMGKTAMVDRLSHHYGLKEGVNGPCMVTLKLRAEVEYKKFKSLVFSALTAGMKFSESNITDEVMLGAVRTLNIRAIGIDEIHNITLATRPDVSKNLAFLRALGGSPFHISVIALGNERAANALASDMQLQRRFENFNLTPWRENLEFRSWLSGLQATLPLKKPSSLAAEKQVKFILQSTNGTTDAIIKLIERAAIWSIIEGVEAVDIEMLKLGSGAMPPLVKP